jgi:UDP-glucose 4-epimerase
VVEVNIRAARREMAVGEVMNIAGGSRVSLHDVIQLLQEMGGTPINTTFAAKQHGDVREIFADTEREADYRIQLVNPLACLMKKR